MYLFNLTVFLDYWLSHIEIIKLMVKFTFNQMMRSHQQISSTIKPICVLYSAPILLRMLFCMNLLF